MNKVYQDETELLYSGTDFGDKAKNPETPPIYHTTAYIVEDTQDYDFANNGGKYFYNRTANPNRDGVAQAITYLEKGEDSIICSSGMAAISTVLLSLLKSGDHILFSKAIYGETIEISEVMLKDFGIQMSFVDFTDLEAIKSNIKENTKIFYTEIIANPLTDVVDLEKIAELAKENGVLTVVDSTFTTPFSIKPLTLGADIVIHSLTKYFGGHSDITGGSITANQKIIDIIQPKFRWLGCCMDPNSAWLAQRSIKTMAMRVNAQFSNAEKLAKALLELLMIKTVYYPGLESHPQHELAKKILNGKYGAMLSFRVEDDREKVDEFMHRLKLVKYLGTLGGIRTTIAHPATAFRNEFTQEQLEEMGMYEGLIRISTGAENIDDLIEDFTQALEVFK